jgi:aquaporin related protein
MNVDIEQPEPTGHHAYGRNLLKRIPIKIRGHIVAVIGEFFGTFCFLFFAFTGAQTANVASNPNTGDTVITATVQKNPAQLLYISLAFGFSLAVNAWVYFRISGGLFNPAVCLPFPIVYATNAND